MRKTIAIIMTIAMVLCFAACGGEKEEAGIDVYVTISTAGEVKLAAEKIRVVDLNEDGKYNYDEALQAAHKKFAPNKLDSYATEDQGYGLCVSKLLDDANGLGAYGYYINNTPAMNLEDEVKEGDYLYAYSYMDIITFSDQYTCFDKYIVKADGKEVDLHLTKMGYDASWNFVTQDYANATITLNGMPFGETDANGNIAISVSGSGNTTISVISTTEAIVPAVCLVIGK